MIEWRGSVDMFQDWTPNACPVIPTNLTPYANAGIAAKIREHTPEGEFDSQHAHWNGGGMLMFTDGRYAWDLPTKRNLRKGTGSDIELMQHKLRGLCYDYHKLKRRGIDTILLPQIGCGLGGLEWQHVWNNIADIVIQLADVFTVKIYAEETHERFGFKV